MQGVLHDPLIANLGISKDVFDTMERVLSYSSMHLPKRRDQRRHRAKARMSEVLPGPPRGFFAGRPRVFLTIPIASSSLSR